LDSRSPFADHAVGRLDDDIEDAADTGPAADRVERIVEIALLDIAEAVHAEQAVAVEDALPGSAHLREHRIDRLPDLRPNFARGPTQPPGVLVS